jgi:CTP synthase
VPVDHKRKEKIAVACNLPADHVISAPDIDSVYDVPLNFERDKLGDILMKSLKLEKRKSTPGLAEWRKFANSVRKGKEAGKKDVHIAIVGKYFNTGDFVLTDAYVSVLEAIKYSAYKLGIHPIIHTVNARDFENEDQVKKGDKISKVPASVFKSLDQFDGILVPGGFGETGIEGKLAVIRYARENKIPYFGLCYGMQLLTIEYARNVLGLKGANTAEIDAKAPHVVIDVMPDQRKKIEEGNYGGSMRLGSYKALLRKGTIAFDAYTKAGWAKPKARTPIVSERHRHRYEVNPEYISQLEAGRGSDETHTSHPGLVFSGTSPDGTLMEIAELPRESHPFFLGTQFHPEFLARPLRPHPLFTEFIRAAIKQGRK